MKTALASFQVLLHYTSLLAWFIISHFSESFKGVRCLLSIWKVEDSFEGLFVPISKFGHDGVVIASVLTTENLLRSL